MRRLTILPVVLVALLLLVGELAEVCAQPVPSGLSPEVDQAIDDYMGILSFGPLLIRIGSVIVAIPCLVESYRSYPKGNKVRAGVFAALAAAVSIGGIWYLPTLLPKI